MRGVTEALRGAFGEGTVDRINEQVATEDIDCPLQTGDALLVDTADPSEMLAESAISHEGCNGMLGKGCDGEAGTELQPFHGRSVLTGCCPSYSQPRHEIFRK